MSVPAFQTEWVDVMEQTRALLHHGCCAPARTITARVSRELGNSIERRKPPKSSLDRFLQDLEVSQSAAASRDACSMQDAQIRAYACAYAEATRLGVGSGHAAVSPSATRVPSSQGEARALTTESMAALLVSAGAKAQLVRAWCRQRAEALAAQNAMDAGKRQLPTVQEAAGVKRAIAEQQEGSSSHINCSISLNEFVECCRVCGVQPAALLGRRGHGGAWASLCTRHADAVAFNPDARSNANATRSAAAPNIKDYAAPVAANTRVASDDDLPTLIRIQQRHAAMESGQRGYCAAAAAAKRTRHAKAEDSRSEDPTESDAATQMDSENGAGRNASLKEGEMPTVRVAPGARLYATPLEKQIVAARVSVSNTQGVSPSSSQHGVSTRDVVAGGLDGRARRAKRRSERARGRTGSALQVATNLAGSVGMISRHLANEHLKARRQEEEATAKFVVDRRKHADRVVRTRYAVHRDRTLARRDRELLRSRLERNAMIEQAHFERQLEEDLIRQFKQKQKVSESTRIIDEHLHPEQLAELRGHERHAALQERAKGNLRQRDAKIAAYTAERKAASQARVLPTMSHRFDGSELEDDELQQGYRTLLSGQQRHALNMQVHADSPFGVDFAVSHPRPLSLSHAPGQGIVPPPPASVAAYRIYAAGGSTLPVPSPVFNSHGPRQFAARCDDDNNALHVLEQKVVNKRYLET